MSLRFRYQLHRTKQGVFPLGGRWVRPRPIIIVSLIGPARTVACEGLLDTGSDDAVFPDRIATRIGLDLTGAPAGEAEGMGGAIIPVRYALVRLRVTDGREFREWAAAVGFTPVPMSRALLGFAGFLQFFSSH